MLKQIQNEETLFANSNRPSKRAKAEIHFEKEWSKNREQFNPLQTAIKRSYFRRLKSIFTNVKGKKCLDLGSGYGLLSKHLNSLGADVTAIDIAPLALKNLDSIPSIKKEIQFIPYTSLPDDTYDYVIGSNLIAELPETEYRLFFSEAARLVKASGTVIISTALDIHSEGALEKLVYLAETEFDIETVEMSYHRLFIQVSKLIPWIRNWDFLIPAFEKITKFFYDQEGVSYVIFTAKRRPLFMT